MTEYKHPIYGNNGLREMTAEEIAEYSKPQEEIETTISDTERIAQLEAELEAIQRAYREGVNA